MADGTALPQVLQGAASEGCFFVNGRKHALPVGRGETTLLTYLRESGLTGTKLGCGEGGCGACTVMLSHWEDGKVVHRSANACLCPLYAVEGMHVVTVEGIGSNRDGLHPVQERLAKAHGSQCGFCTPGFIMSMYSLLRSKAGTEAPTEEEIEDALGGNLCRCTGYRPILDAFRVFAKADPKAYTEEAIAAAKGVPRGSPAANGVCPSSGMPCDCRINGGGCGGDQAANRYHAAGNGMNGHHHEGAAAANGATAAGDCGGEGGCGKCGGAGMLPAMRPTKEPIFPPELKVKKAALLHMPGPVVNWWRPATLDQLLALKVLHPTAKLVVGNTEVGIEMKFKDMKYPVIIAPTHVPEMNAIEVTEAGVTVGAAVTLTRLMKFLKQQIAERPACQTSTLQAVVNQLRWFAGNQIRNVSALGGNIVTGSPISDLNPIWMASGSVFTALGQGTGERSVPASEFFLGYRQVDLKPHEVLFKVHIPFTQQYEYVKEYKQSPRREDDIAIVNACVRVRLGKDESGAWVVAEAAVAFGGVAAKAIMGKEVAAALVGRPLDQSALAGVLEAVKRDVQIGDNAPGGKVEYRRALAASFLFKFYVHMACKLEEDTQAAFKADVTEQQRSAVRAYDRPRAQGVQFAAEALPGEVVGTSYQHMAADLQVTGEATYTDDIALPASALVGVCVTSTKPHAKILKVDASKALALEGVAGYFSSKDVPGSNMIGPVVLDEEVFATDTVTCVGQVIGVVVAETEALARRAAKLIEVEYQELPAIMSCEEAVAASAFYSYANRIETGNVEQGLAEAEHIISGTYKLQGQEHFYLETNSCVVLPTENDEFTISASTQAPAKHQKCVASVLGIPANRVVSKAKRLGGGFGGKETRSIFLHCVAAVPSYHLRRAVRITLDRDEDMQMSGQRHAFMCNYKVGFTSQGKLVAVDLQLYGNAGNSWDLSASVMDRALLHSDCVYKVPHLRAAGRLCRTNQSSQTAFRGFGGPQGLMFAEMWIEQIAKTLGKPDHVVRQANMYKEGEQTHFGQVLEHNRIGACWSEVLSSSSYEQRLAGVQAFNAQNRYRKRGLAITPTKFGISFTTKFLNQAGALVHVYLDGSVLVTHGGVEMGQGLHTKMAQIAAQALGVPLSKVFVSETSTDKVPNASPTAASASSDMYGGAVLDACTQIMQKLQPYKEKFADRTWKEVVNAAYLDRVDLSAHGFYSTPNITGFGGSRPFSYFCFGASASEVELDVLTGDWHIVRSDVVMDVGNPLNPAIDIGQVEGGFVQGMGWLCLEELQWGDKQHPWVRPGHLFTKGPGTYKIPSANDIPVDFRVSLLRDAPNVRAIHSSKAVGEPPFHLGASVFFALKEAVYAARKDVGHHGYFVLDAPATPERLRMLCADEIAAQYAPADFRAKISC